MHWLRRTGQILLHVEDSPSRVALAFALGVFIAFFPVLGVHTAMAIAMALVFRLNKVALLAGTFANNPWTVAPMYSAGTLLGCAVLGVSPASLGAIDWDLSGRAFYESLVTGLRPLLVPFVVGNLALGALAAATAFVLLRTLLARRRRVIPRDLSGPVPRDLPTPAPTIADPSAPDPKEAPRDDRGGRARGGA
jgi:uncharacterized protein (DUF2062 family)